MEKPFPAYRGDAPYVFVCYAHIDNERVYPEINWLHDQGVHIWYDEGISAGKNWRAEIGNSLLKAEHVLFFVSDGSLNSDHCNREINLALDEGKTVIPIYLEDVELTADLKIGLSRVQALRFDDGEYRRQMLEALGNSKAEEITGGETPAAKEQTSGSARIISGQIDGQIDRR